MTLATSAIHRSLGKLAISVQKASDRRRAEKAAEGLAEVDQQFQVDLSGRAGELTWQTVTIDFDEMFVDASGQRDADLDEPHFTYGATMQKGPPLIISAHVSDWATDAQGNFTGAAVRIGVWNPLAIAQTEGELGSPFLARLHVNFQGFSVPHDPSDEDN